jgi:hypothetical protein
MFYGIVNFVSRHAVCIVEKKRRGICGKEIKIKNKNYVVVHLQYLRVVICNNNLINFVTFMTDPGAALSAFSYYDANFAKYYKN